MDFHTKWVSSCLSLSSRVSQLIIICTAYHHHPRSHEKEPPVGERQRRTSEEGRRPYRGEQWPPLREGRHRG